MKYYEDGQWKDVQIKVANAIENEYGESNNDGYSQNYLNDHLINVSNEVDEDYRVNVLHSNNLLKYPYTDTTKTNNGITFTDNGDGSITISGTAIANTSFSLLGTDTNQFEIEGNYLNGGVNNNIYIRVVNYTSSYTILGTSSGSETHINKSTYKKGYIEIRVNNGTAITTPITIKPIMTKESYSGEWQPYITPSINVDGDTIVSKMAKVNYFNSSWLESGFYVHTNSNYFYKNADGLITFQIGIKTSNAISTATAFPIMTIPNELMPKANTIFAGYSYQKGAMATYIRKSDNKFLIKPFVALSADDEINISGSYYLED